MKVKSNRYYKRPYTDNGTVFLYDIIYTDNKWVYIIAEKTYNKPLIKLNKKVKYSSINEYQDYIANGLINIQEMTKEDVFLELL